MDKMRDPLGEFLAACTRRCLGNDVQASVLYARFCEWAAANGEQVWPIKKFARLMKARGMQAKKSNFILWVDLELKRSS